MAQLESALQWRGQTMYDRDGDKIGLIEEIYLDQETGAAGWALVNTGLIGRKSTFVPIAHAAPSEDGVRVPFEKSHVEDAPGIDFDGELSQEAESELYSHYGMDYGESRPEEEVRIGKTRGEARRVHLRKCVVTEPATETVPVQREEEVVVEKRAMPREWVRLDEDVTADERV